MMWPHFKAESADFGVNSCREICYIQCQRSNLRAGLCVDHDGELLCRGQTALQ